MKHRKLLSLFLAAAMAVSMSGCSGNGNGSGESGDSNVSSGSSGEDSGVVEMPTSSRVSENGWKFGQVAMGGGGFVSGVFATSQDGLYYARTDVGGASR